MTDPRFAREKRLTVLARHRQSVHRRWAFGLLGLALGLCDAALDFFPAPWWAVALPSAVLLLGNAWCAWRIRADHIRVRHFWAMLCADAVATAATCAMTGDHGELAVAFYVVVAAAYGLGLPRAARVHVAVTAVVYPIARLVSGTPRTTVALETAVLVALSWLAIASPMRFTYRLRRARRALDSLERGDFSVRLPTRALDDLGFLAVSFNSTAEALGTAVEELRRSREALAHQAYHDPLTGLANRARFQERLVRALAGEHAPQVAVLMVDLDDFKCVNDRLGHAAGDRLLVMVGERLLNATRGGDTVARLGGDEFAVLVEKVAQSSDVEIIARRILHALAAPFVIDGVDLHVGASIGVARHGGPPGDAEAGDALLHRADIAMYDVKTRGKNAFAVDGVQAPPVRRRALALVQ
ncbi:diguanylate cyclase [Gemmatirosa kalamazoonensis]|uniref:Diguanylate cyclase n=1 Tax=Gemmatirosa kalamazoonensis TaxID=861299 RepID=W0RAF6_9BACT|nr:GGDEF domain-containing protein [Gemmatirosa kalamazoonensis]AHG87761.1 diguanylate cyclase [Gemmatirosa kalamazoonensis]